MEGDAVGSSVGEIGATVGLRELGANVGLVGAVVGVRDGPVGSSVGNAVA